MIGIKAVSSFFSNSYLDIEDIEGIEYLKPEEYTYFLNLGIEGVCHAEGYSAYDMAREASAKLLVENQIDPKDINLIIYIQDRLPSYLVSSCAARLQYDIGAVNATSFSVSDLGCTDMTMAIKLAKDQLSLNMEMNNVIICYGHKQYASTRFRYPVTVNGDGGLALLVSRTEVNQIIDIEIKTNGKYWDLFQVDYLDKPFEKYDELCTNHRNYGFELPIVTKMNIAEINTSIFTRNNISLSDIDHYLLQNLSERAYDFTESSLDITLAKSCSENLKRYGHLGPLDVILNLKTGVESGCIKSGERVLIMNNSPVAAWSSILLQA